MNRLAAGWTRLQTRPHSRPDGRLTDVFVLATLSALPLTVLAHAFLPDRFSADSRSIVLIAQGRFAPTGDRSYYNVGKLYAALGMADRPWLAASLGIVLGSWALWAALRQARGTLTVPAAALIALFVVTWSVYLTQYSKDVWVLPVVLISLLVGPGAAGEVALVAVIVVYALEFRSYWFLVLLIYLALRVVSWGRLRARRVLLVVLLVVVVATLLAPLVLGEDIQAIRASSNAGRANSADARTLITPLNLGSGPVAESVENLLTLFGLLVPLPLAALGSPLYLIYAFALAFAWICFARVTWRGASRVFQGTRNPGNDRLVRWSLLAVAFVTTQGFFEPDYGSYIRHLTPVLPLVIAVVLRAPGTRFLAPANDRGTGRSTDPDPPHPWEPGGRTTANGVAMRFSGSPRDRIQEGTTWDSATTPGRSPAAGDWSSRDS